MTLRQMRVLMRHYEDRRHRRARPPGPRPAPAGQDGHRERLPGCLPVGPRARLRGHHRNGHGSIPRSETPPRHAVRRGAGRRPGHRVAQRAWRRSRGLGVGPSCALEGRQPLQPCASSAWASATSRVATRCSAGKSSRAFDIDAVAERGLLVPDRAHLPRRVAASAWPRCPSCSSTAARPLQDEPPHLRRGGAHGTPPPPRRPARTPLESRLAVLKGCWVTWWAREGRLPRGPHPLQIRLEQH
jgi:hypothetical protein